MNKNLEQAIKVLKKGGIVIFPTDTAFGIGCRIDRQSSVERLFKIRRRPKLKATPVLFESIDQVLDYVLSIDPKVLDLMRKHWPGALTIILPAKLSKVPELVRGGGGNIGVRIPDHIDTLSLISGVGVPILGPSANIHGEATPFSESELHRKLISKVDFVLSGKTKLSLASTVIDCTKTPFRVLRLGAITDI